MAWYASEATEALQKLHRSIEEAGTYGCRDRSDEAVDWIDRDAFPPDGFDAELLCWECPVRLQCMGYATAAGDVSGIWGGYVWMNGKRVSYGEEWDYGEAD